MLRVLFYILLIAISFATCGLSAQQANKKILVFSKTAGYYHESIPAGVKAIQALGREHHINVDTTKDAKVFNEGNLKTYDAVVFLSTTGDVLNSLQQKAFENYIHSGGNFVGIHAASTTEYQWPWYGRLVGGVFNGHPEPQHGDIHVTSLKNKATSHLPTIWKWYDEWYNFKSIQGDINVLLTVDESTYKGGTNGDNHPLAWFREFEGARSFYTALGHFDTAYSNPQFLKHILAGIQYAIGEKLVANESTQKNTKK